MENNILQLIKIITALYFEDLAEDDGTHIIEEIQQALSNIKIDNRGSSGLGSEDAAIESLRYTAEWMLTNTSVGYSRENILQRLTVNLQCNNDYIEIASNSLDEKITALTARKRVNEILSELRFEKRKSRLRQLITKANAQINFSGDFIDNSVFIRELMGELENMGSVDSEEIIGHVGTVNFDDAKAIRSALEKSVEANSTEGLLDTGFQGMNKACGGNGIPRGAMVNVAALTHCYKSGMLIDLALNIPMHNDPWMWDIEKKPLILRISFENTIEQDISIMYQKLHEIKNQERCKLSDINIDIAGVTLRDHFATRGYHFALESYDPNNFSVYDLFDILNKYLEAGYEIHAVSCDYLTQISHNTIGDRDDVKIQKTYEMVRNFCYP